MSAEPSSPRVLPHAEAVRRDQVLRAYLIGRDWDAEGEPALRRTLVMQSERLLPDYPLLIGVEWATLDGRPGDLLFYDGHDRLLVVEVKVLGKREPQKRRNIVQEQARAFAKAARRLHPHAEVEARVYTCDEERAGAGPRAP
jgi:hypothetical protein